MSSPILDKNNQYLATGGIQTGIYVFAAPSPAARFFVLPKKYSTTKGRTVSFHTVPEGEILAGQLMNQKTLVQQVTIGPYPHGTDHDCVTVTFRDPTFWQDPKMLDLVGTKIWSELQSLKKDPNRTIINHRYIQAKESFGQVVQRYKQAGNTDEIAELKAALEIFSDATVARDGGRLELISYDADQKLTVAFRSACGSCPTTQGTEIGFKKYLNEMMQARKIPIVRALNMVKMA